jgi:Protein kinase domain
VAGARAVPLEGPVTEEIGAAAFEAAPGTQIAGYQVEAEIGRGGMAIVYRALDSKLGRPVALKILAPRLAEDESFRRRFIHESRAAAAVDHPNIIPVFEAGEADGCLFIAMRYVRTGDVRTRLERQGRLGVRRVVTIVSQVSSALDVAHSRGLVHRDVKPANILLAESSDGRLHVYLSDFGLSKLTLAPTGLTSTGQFMGTLDYVAPEQIEGKAVDGRADLYALACATVEMLTGAPPFRRAENMALMWAQLSEPPPVLSERCPDLPPAIDQVIIRALAKAPGDRYRTCREFAAALQAAALVQPRAGAWGASLGQVRPPTEQAYLPGAQHTALDAAAGPAMDAAQPGPAGAAGPSGFPAAAGLGLAGRAEQAGPAAPSDYPAAAPAPAGQAAPADLAGRPAQPVSPTQTGMPGQAISSAPSPWSSAAAAHPPTSAIPGSVSPGPARPGAALPPSAGPVSAGSPPSRSAWPGSAWSESDLPPAPDEWFRPASGVSQAASPESQAPVDPRWLSQGTPATVPPGPAAHRAPRRGRAGLVIVITIVVLLCLGAAGYLAQRHRVASQAVGATRSAAAATSPATVQTRPLLTAPARTVVAYFRAINHHRYGRAWALGGKNTGVSYSAFVSGFSNTAHDSVQITSVTGDVVSARLTATQTDGTVQTYQGTYTVTGGQIVRFNIQRLS